MLSCQTIHAQNIGRKLVNLHLGLNNCIRFHSFSQEVKKIIFVSGNYEFVLNIFLHNGKPAFIAR